MKRLIRGCGVFFLIIIIFATIIYFTSSKKELEEMGIGEIKTLLQYKEAVEKEVSWDTFKKYTSLKFLYELRKMDSSNPDIYIEKLENYKSNINKLTSLVIRLKSKIDNEEIKKLNDLFEKYFRITYKFSEDFINYIENITSSMMTYYRKKLDKTSDEMVSMLDKIKDRYKYIIESQNETDILEILK
ncbi:hypothetical protein SU69_05400 [Thermosipho melanesiensis]|uniref:Uncharacterized protein n=2 Tax=Thermosipho melanesiensis TaxID=46541 RepID=A6LLW6_THEM4|nr:hypothetical protein [Thermosipho melanesiensis]ABR30917.1 hypothetical protein Tmel_1057 [Thermosipho melanesiensis BI429]APT74867.1 hypothetical protein BW47_05650 [Thermosipho melanesiensis]OOC35962.1 hypothetical protein SU68_05460 [Thermosipho melanesiensis]OOC38101.1 hypothetical protein SU69_05400 [Thermosipho melanesiensis]OOC38231.1 hypothetical protein SU70_05410 [Thermosipho melanesiensis]